MRIIYGFLVFIGILLLVLPVAVPIIKTSAEFSVFNTNWNGCSKFAKLLAEKGTVVPIMYPYNSVKLHNLNGALIVIGPDIDFSSLEVREVKQFLENGGVLFIADDFGTANGLLEKLGVKVRFSKIPLEDIFYSKRSEFPVVVRIDDPELAVNVDKIVLNVPSAIIGYSGGVVFTSKVSVVGKNMKSYPILAELKYGRGRIILLSDPSILINDMFDVNKQFIDNLIRYLGVKVFYIDEAHHSDFNPYSIATIYIQRDLDRTKAFQVFVAVAALAVFIECGIAHKIMRKIVSILPKRKRDIFEELPDWVDRKILEKMINEIKTGSKIGDNHGWKGVSGETKKGS